MDIRNLSTFIQVAELGSFTKAARKLGYSQSTVSFQIRQLEEELQVSLFDRINHTILLTEKGREVLDYAHRMHRLTMEMKNSMREERRVTGHVRLGMADSLCSSLLREGFGGFREQFPEINLKIITAGTGEMFRLLNHNEVDAILTLDDPVHNREYRIVCEEKEEVYFVAGSGSGGFREEPVSMETVMAYPFILTEKGMSYRRLLDEELARRSLELTPVLEIGSTDVICRMVEQGLGISFLPDYVVGRLVEQGRIRRLNVKGFSVQVWKQLIYHRDKWVFPAMEAVLRYCAEREFQNCFAIQSGKEGGRVQEGS